MRRNMLGAGALAAAAIVLVGVRVQAEEPKQTTPPIVRPGVVNNPVKKEPGSPSSPVNPVQKGTPATPTISTSNANVNVPDLWKQINDLNQKLYQDVTKLEGELKAANDRITQLQSQVNDFQAQYAKHTHTYYTEQYSWITAQNVVNNPNMLGALIPFKTQSTPPVPWSVQTSPPQ